MWQAKTSAHRDVAKVVELPSDAIGVVVALLCPVQLKRLAPHGVDLLALAKGGMRVAQLVESIGDLGSVAEVSEQGEGLLVLADCLLVVAGAVGDVAQAVEGARLTGGVVVAAKEAERPGICRGLGGGRRIWRHTSPLR